MRPGCTSGSGGASLRRESVGGRVGVENKLRDSAFR